MERRTPLPIIGAGPFGLTMAAQARRLAPDAQEAIGRRLWAEGRLKVEPWLEPRLQGSAVRVRPHTRVQTTSVNPAGDIEVTLDPEGASPSIRSSSRRD